MGATDPRFRWDALPNDVVADGITAAIVVGERLSVARYLLNPGAVVPEHAHDNEEFGQVLAGAIELRVGDTWTTVGPGEAFVVPANVPHDARALTDGCELLECYAPARRPIPRTDSPEDRT